MTTHDEFQTVKALCAAVASGNLIASDLIGFAHTNASDGQTVCLTFTNDAFGKLGAAADAFARLIDPDTVGTPAGRTAP